MKKLILFAAVIFSGLSASASISYLPMKSDPDFANKVLNGEVENVTYTSFADAEDYVIATIQLNAKVYGTSSVEVIFTGKDVATGMALSGAVGKPVSILLSSSAGTPSSHTSISIGKVK